MNFQRFVAIFIVW